MGAVEVDMKTSNKTESGTAAGKNEQQKNTVNRQAFQFIVVHTPTATLDQVNAQAQPPSVIVAGPTVVMAKSEAAARTQATLAIPTAFQENLDEVEVVVRPFG